MPTRPHILLAEDNALVGGAMRVLFEETGHRVTITTTIIATVDAALADPPDLLLLDLGLADGDGLLVLSRLRARGVAPITVALTGRDDPETAERCRIAGCVDVLVKPVPTRQLLARVRELVGRV